MAYRRLFDLFHAQLAAAPLKRALAGDGEPAGHSTEHCLAQVDRVSAGFLALGLTRGDRVALIGSSGSPRWLWLDLGLQQLGIMGLALHASTPAPQLERHLLEGQVKACLVSDRGLYEAVAAFRHKLPGMKHLFTWNDLPDLPGWSDLLREPNERQLETFHSTRAAVHEDDPAFVAYTSGGNGRPRGVVLTHKNLISNIRALAGTLDLPAGQRYLSLMPPSLIYGRLALYTAIARGDTVHFRRPEERIPDAFARVKPHYACLLPGMLEQVYDHLIGETLRGNRLRRGLGLRAARAGRQTLGQRVARALVLPAWKRRLGGQLSAMIVLGDRLRPQLGRLFSAAGNRVWQGYGLTETAGLAALGPVRTGRKQPEPGFTLLDHLDARLQAADEAGQGTLILRGPNVMPDYLDAEPGKIPGDWLVTGDRVRLDGRRLQIDGPVHETIRLADGTILNPSHWEAILRNSPFVDQCLVVGTGQPHAGALILPRFSLLQRWCAEQEVPWKAPAFIVSHPRVLDLFHREIQNLEAQGTIRSLSLIHKPWTVEGGELTPTMKVRRSVLRERHARDMEKLWKETGT